MRNFINFTLWTLLYGHGLFWERVWSFYPQPYIFNPSPIFLPPALYSTIYSVQKTQCQIVQAPEEREKASDGARFLTLEYKEYI